MTLFCKSRFRYERGCANVAVIALASVLGCSVGCSGDSTDTEESQNPLKPGKAKPDVQAVQLGEGEERCKDADKGRVCVTNVETADGGTHVPADRHSDAGRNDRPPVASSNDGSSSPEAPVTNDDNVTNDGNSVADAGVEISDIAQLPDAGAGGDTSSQDQGSTAPEWVECTAIEGIVRDFRRGDREGGHPDFETRPGIDEKGLLKRKLSSEGRPQLALSRPLSIESASSFSQWYEDVPGVNAAFNIALQLERDGQYQEFGTTSFFPLDDLGFGHEDLGHNFGFTTELHAKFLYEGSGTFELTGDDDLWLFVNGRLVIDLGGVHAWQTDTVDLAERAKELGLEPGNVYTLDVFHAERHSNESKLMARTNLYLVDCD